MLDDWHEIVILSFMKSSDTMRYHFNKDFLLTFSFSLVFQEFDTDVSLLTITMRFANLLCTHTMKSDGDNTWDVLLSS